MSLREVFTIWNRKPGGFKIRFYVPRMLAKLTLTPIGPLLRLAGLPAFFSGETVVASSGSYNFSGAKAQRELGWVYRPAGEMWEQIIEEELQLLAARQQRDLASRLRPVLPNIVPQSTVVNVSPPLDYEGVSRSTVP